MKTQITDNWMYITWETSAENGTDHMYVFIEDLTYIICTDIKIIWSFWEEISAISQSELPICVVMIL